MYIYKHQNQTFELLQPSSCKISAVRLLNSAPACRKTDTSRYVNTYVYKYIYICVYINIHIYEYQKTFEIERWIKW